MTRNITIICPCGATFSSWWRQGTTREKYCDRCKVERRRQAWRSWYGRNK